MNLARQAIATIVLIVSWMSVSSQASADEGRPRYRRDILPLLSDRCFQCHGPDSAARQASLRLDQRDSAISELDSGVKAIVPGDSARSALIERIESSDPDLVMPPTNSGKALSAAEKSLLRSWIEQGAEYEPH